MKRIFFTFPLFVLFFTTAVFLWWKNASSPVNPQDTGQRDFLIVKGQSVEQIGKNLEKEGLVKSSFAFKLYTQVTGRDKEIQAGDYRLSPNLSLQQLVLALLSGPQELWITYPEGFRREEIAIKTIKTLQMEEARAEEFWQEFITETEDMEGFLFPDTYLFARDVKASTVAQKLRSTFNSKITDKMRQDAQKAGLTLDQVVTLASIVERETKTGDERPIVAGILIKRWRANWPLQADATLQYVLASQNCPTRQLQLECKWWNIPTAQHKSLKSAFNTYLNPGIPPGPIASPGLESIKAVIYPKETPYWFYLHDKDGKIRYAETIEEHNENVLRFLK